MHNGCRPSACSLLAGWAGTLAAQRGWDPVLTPWAVAVAGEQLLGAGEVFAIGPLQLYAVTEQLQQGKPTCASGDAKTDLGHILDFTCRLKYLKVKLWELLVMGNCSVVGTQLMTWVCVVGQGSVWGVFVCVCIPRRP